MNHKHSIFKSFWTHSLRYCRQKNYSLWNQNLVETTLTTTSTTVSNSGAQTTTTKDDELLIAIGLIINIRFFNYAFYSLLKILLMTNSIVWKCQMKNKWMILRKVMTNLNAYQPVILGHHGSVQLVRVKIVMGTILRRYKCIGPWIESKLNARMLM